MSNRPVLLYLHIPKAGGTSFNDWLYMQVKSDKNCDQDNEWFQSGIYYYPSGYVSVPDADADLQLSRPDLRAVVGHFKFGIHQHIAVKTAYITLMRNPVDRVISLYNFQRLIEKTQGSHHGVCLPSSMTLDDFVAHPPYKEIDNGQTRRISGIDAPIGECDSTMLEKAKQNLENYFSVVGLTERFDEFLVLLTRFFGLSKEQVYYPKNITVVGKTSEDHSEKTIELIRQNNALDIELYDFAKNLFEIQIEKQGSDYCVDLNNFRNLKLAYFNEVGGWNIPSVFK